MSSRKDIKVPKAYKHMLRSERTTTEEYMPTIRAYLDGRPKVPLTTADFNRALNTTKP